LFIVAAKTAAVHTTAIQQPLIAKLLFEKIENFCAARGK
jgi:hypothetical protein